MISLIVTVLNEGDSIDPLMLSILAQTCQPDELVIVDGGSTDQTVSVIQSYADRLPLRVVVEPGANISRGRNRAIAESRGDIIAITDAGVRLESGWLQQLTQPLLDDPALMVAAGFFAADPRTRFEVAMGAAVLPVAADIDPATFLPSSRSVAVRRAALERASVYPEWLDYCEDLIFDLRLRTSGAPFVFVPQAVAYFRPRGSLRSYFKQYYLYARGDGKADLWRRRHAVRYVTYLVAAPLLLLLGWRVHWLLWGLFPLGGAVYLRAPYARLPQVMRHSPDRSAAAWLYVALMIPIIRLVGDIAKMIGYPVGWCWRLRQRPPDWRE